MKLMIDIPDEAYELLKSKSEMDNIAESIIANGTPITEGEWVEEEPTADDREMGFDLRIVCSNCRFPNCHYEYDENHNPKSVVYVRTRYCPECGKRMIRDFNGQEIK